MLKLSQEWYEFPSFPAGLHFQDDLWEFRKMNIREGFSLEKNGKIPRLPFFTDLETLNITNILLLSLLFDIKNVISIFGILEICFIKRNFESHERCHHQHQTQPRRLWEEISIHYCDICNSSLTINMIISPQPVWYGVYSSQKLYTLSIFLHPLYFSLFRRFSIETLKWRFYPHIEFSSPDICDIEKSFSYSSLPPL